MAPAGLSAIALLGASGWTGSFVLAELRNRGLPVRAIVRRDDALPGASVTQVRADVFDDGQLAKALRGADAVVSAFAPGWDDPDLYQRCLDGARAIQRATKVAGASRLIVIGGATTLVGSDGRQLIHSLDIPERVRAAGRAACDYLGELTAETDLDWVVLSPPPSFGRFGPQTRRGTYRTGTDSPVLDADGNSSISGPDLAIAVVDEVEYQRFHRQRYTVGY